MDTIVLNLEQTAGRHPERCAIRSRHRTVNFRELWNLVQCQAALCIDRGLRAQDRVALVLDNSVEYAVAFYGVLAAGGVVVALNPAAKSRDYRHWLEHSAVQWLIADPANREAVAACTALAYPPQTMAIAVDGETTAPDDIARPSGPRSDVPALLLYTSGTTGDPKGVLLSHGNLASNTAAIVQYLRLGATDVSVVVLPFFYSYGNSLLHTHVAAGATLVLEPNLVYPHKVVEAMVEHRATGLAGVPSTFGLLLSRVRLADYDLSALRYLTQAGGAMPVQLSRQLRAALPQAQLYQMYGQTEATARISYLPPEYLDDKPASVGVPLPGVAISVRREDGSRAAPMESGEVWVRGPNVMLGYWRNEAATAAVRDGDWLRTGDVGHLDADGYLYLAGRRSDMIKTGAHRVNPRDIEEVISELPGVAEVAVVPAPDGLLGEVIRAVVVLQAGAALDEMRVKAWCRERLAAYKVPKQVEFSDGLPRTASGKIRRQALVSGSDE